MTKGCTATMRGQYSLYFTIGRPFPLKTAPTVGGSKPSSNTWFIEPTQVHNPNGITFGSADFCQAHDRDRQTDHTTPPVTTGHIYLSTYCDVA